jgi:DNA polymerase-4
VEPSILHVDMDAFYVAVEQRDDPSLVGRPMAVGGRQRGVVLSASYEARARGVRSGMPMTRARRLCPGLLVVPPRFDRYAGVSAGVMAVFATITPAVQPMALDEAFLDVRGARRRLGPSVRIAELIRARVADEQGITCSVGVADSMLVAKVASASCKPDGLRVVPAADVVGFLHPLPVGALWGVGEATQTRLADLGLRTVGDLAHTPRPTLVRAFGEHLGRHLAAMAWGEDRRQVLSLPPVADRSVGSQRTFRADVDDTSVLRRALLDLSTSIGARLRRARLAGRTVTLTVRFADFATITRSRTLRDPTDLAHDITAAATVLLDALGLQRARVRLIGLRVSSTVPAAEAARQLGLLDRPVGWREAERAVDAAVARFGSGALRPATLIPDPKVG